MENLTDHPAPPISFSTSKHPRKSREYNLLLGIVSLSLLWLIPVLACGSFQPRDVPTSVPPTPVPANAADGENAGSANSGSANAGADGNNSVSISEATPLPAIPTATLPPLPTPTFTATPLPGTVLVAGQPARVVAPNGLNMRQSASSSTQLVLQLGTGQLVTVLEGPVSADGFTWWQVEDQQGSSGWVADGDDETTWLSPNVGDPQPVGRPPQVGDRVRVTMDAGLQLTIRALPGTDGPLITRANPGTEFTVVNGPQAANGYSWYQIRSDDGTLLGWAADSDLQKEDRWLSPIE